MTATDENKERLQKLLARAGIASRRKSEELITKGHVSVNGETVRILGTKVDPAVDEVRVDTILVKVPRGPMVLLVNKPRGYLSTTRDEQGRKTVLDLIPDLGRRLFPAGRLDEDSEGLLLLSDDGELTNLVTHPRYGVPKTYDLRIRGHLTGEAVKRVESGVWLSEGKTARSRIRVRKSGREISRAEVTLTEGRNRELRRIFAKIGHAVLSLRRNRIGNLDIKGLKTGHWRKVKGAEVRELRALAKKR